MIQDESMAPQNSLFFEPPLYNAHTNTRKPGCKHRLNHNECRCTQTGDL